jgi:ribonuclease Z
VRPRLVLLGTSAALPTATRDNVALLVEGPRQALLVDCPGGPLQKIQRVGVDPLRLSHLVVTHAHADHVSGVPMLLQGLWLLGRRDPLAIVGPPHALSLVQDLVDVFRPTSWADQFPLEYREVEAASGVVAVEEGDFTVWTAPGEHAVPTIAVCIAVEGADGAVAYSSDTRPAEAVRQLAQGVNLLVHEATFLERDAAVAERTGHSTAAQAGHVARRCGARRLVLVHCSPRTPEEADALRQEAARAFGGPVDVPEDLTTYEL